MALQGAMGPWLRIADRHTLENINFVFSNISDMIYILLNAKLMLLLDTLNTYIKSHNKLGQLQQEIFLRLDYKPMLESYTDLLSSAPTSYNIWMLTLNS